MASAAVGLNAGTAPVANFGPSQQQEEEQEEEQQQHQQQQQQQQVLVTTHDRESELLEQAGRKIDEDRPWYETLGLRWEKVGDTGGEVAVEAVLAFNVVSGLIDAANKTALAPVFVILKGLLDSVQRAAEVRDEIIELVEYCVGISRCLLEAATAKDMPQTITVTMHDFQSEMTAVKAFVQNYHAQTGCCWKATLSARDRATAAGHRSKLKALLEVVLVGLATQSYLDGQKLVQMMTGKDPPALATLAEVPAGTPLLPATYVERLATVERVVLDLTDAERSSSEVHSLVGMGGSGKTLLASSVVRDDRVRSSFRNGIFWVPVGREGKASNAALLLENVARDLATRMRTNVPMHSPFGNGFGSAGETARYVARVLARRSNGGNGSGEGSGKGDGDGDGDGDCLRCLVVLDDVWDVEVVDVFATTGFHVLVTTRQRDVVSATHGRGLYTDVGDMNPGEALELLRKASQAHGPLPETEAAQVASDCGMLPLALGIAGALAKDQPLAPASWQGVHEELQEKFAKLREMERGVLFSTIDASFGHLPKAQKRQFQLMAVMAPGAVATQEMLANLWDTDVSDVPTGGTVLENHSLLQAAGEEHYRLHDLVLEYLELTINMGGDTLAKDASSRQARYLSRVGVLHEYAAGDKAGSGGGLYSLLFLWNSASKLRGELDVEACYADSLTGVTETTPWREAGHLLELLGKYSGAEKMLRKASEMAERERAESEDVARALASLGGVLELQGKYAEADASYLRAVEVGEKALGPDHPNIAIILNGRATVLKAQGRYAEAGALYLRAKEIDESVMGPDHADLAPLLNNQAGLSKAQGKYAEAYELYRRAIEVAEKTLDPDHPDVAAILTNFVGLLRTQGKLAEAEELTFRAEKILEKSFGPDHPHIAAAVTHRAGLLEDQGKFAEAEELYLRAQGIIEEAHGLLHPRVAFALNDRAGLARNQGKHAEALDLYAQATQILENAHGPEHPYVATGLSNQAALLGAQGRYEEADPVCARAIEVGERALGSDHPGVATALTCRAGILKAQGKFDEAIPLLERALAIRTSALGDEDEDTLYSVVALEAVRDAQVRAMQAATATEVGAE